MTKTFTRNEMLRYYYDEMEPDEIIDFQNALSKDPDLNANFNELCRQLATLDNVKAQPSEHTVTKILEFSRNFDLTPKIKA